MFVIFVGLYNNLKNLMTEGMDTNINSTLEKSNGVFGMQTIFVEPFLHILKVEDTTKECTATRARTLSTKTL